MPGKLNGETRLFPIIGDPIIYVKSRDLYPNAGGGRGIGSRHARYHTNRQYRWLVDHHAT